MSSSHEEEEEHTEHHHHSPHRYRFDEPVFGNDDYNPIIRASIKDVLDNGLEESDRGPCSHALIAFRKCRDLNFFQPGLCSHQGHELHGCQLENFKRRVRVKMRQDLGDEFSEGFFAKREEMYRHQLLVRQVAQLIEKKEKRDKEAKKRH